MRISRVSQCCGTRGSLSSVDFQPHAQRRSVHRIATAAGTEVQIWALWRDDSTPKRSALKCICLHTFHEHSPYEVATARWSPNGRYLASTDSGGTTHILERNDAKCRQLEHSLSDNRDAVNADDVASASEPGAAAPETKVTRKFTFKYDGTTAKRQRQTSMPNRTKPGKKRISYDSQSVKTEVVKPVTVESNGGNFEVWTSIQSFQCPSRMGQLFDISWAPDNRSIVGGGLNGQVAVFDIFTKQMVAHFDVFEGQRPDSAVNSRGYVKSVAWDPMTLYIAVQTSSREASVWRRSPPNPEGSAQKWTFKRVFCDTDLFQKSQCDVLGGSRISWAPNGQLVAFPSAGKSTLNFAACFEVVHADLSREVAVLLDGKLDHRRLQLVYDNADHNVRQDAMLLHGHQARVRNVRFSQDLMVPHKRGLCKGATFSDSDRFVLYAQSSDDGTISIWRFKHASNWDSQYKNEAQCICVLQNASDEQSSLEDLAWGNGGRWLAVAASQGGIILVELSEDDTSTRFYSNWMSGLKIEDTQGVTTSFLHKVEQYQSKKTSQASTGSAAKEQSEPPSDCKNAAGTSEVSDVTPAIVTAGSAAWVATGGMRRYAAQYYQTFGGSLSKLLSVPLGLKCHFGGVMGIEAKQLMQCVTAMLLSTLMKALQGIAEALVTAAAIILCHARRTIATPRMPVLCRTAAISDSRIVQAHVDIASGPASFGQGVELSATAIRGINVKHVGSMDPTRLYDPDSADPCLGQSEFGRQDLVTYECSTGLPSSTNGCDGLGDAYNNYSGENTAASLTHSNSGTVESVVATAVTETSPSQGAAYADSQSATAGEAKQIALGAISALSPTSNTSRNKRLADERTVASPHKRGRPPGRKWKAPPVTVDRITDVWLSMEYPQGEDDLVELLKTVEKAVTAADTNPPEAPQQEPVAPVEPEVSQPAATTEKRESFEAPVPDTPKEVEETLVEAETTEVSKSPEVPPSSIEKKLLAQPISPPRFNSHAAAPPQMASSLKQSPLGLQHYLSSSRNSAMNSPLLTDGLRFVSSPIAASSQMSPPLVVPPRMSPIWAGSLDLAANMKAGFGPPVGGLQQNTTLHRHFQAVPAPPQLQLDQKRPSTRAEGLFEVPPIRPSLSVQLQGARRQLVVVNRAHSMCSAFVACVENKGNGTQGVQWTKQINKGYATHICPIHSQGMALIVTQIGHRSSRRGSHDFAQPLHTRRPPVGGGQAVDTDPAGSNAKPVFASFFTLLDTRTGLTLIDGYPIPNFNIARLNVFPCGNRIYAAFTATRGAIALFVFYRKLGSIAWTILPNIAMSVSDLLKRGTCADIKQLQLLCVNLNAAQCSTPQSSALALMITKEKARAEAVNVAPQPLNPEVAAASNNIDQNVSEPSRKRPHVEGKERDTTFVAMLVYMNEPQVYVLTQYYEPFLINLAPVHKLFHPKKSASNVLSFASLCNTYRRELGRIEGPDHEGNALFNDVVHRLADIFHLNPSLKDHYSYPKTEKVVEEVVVDAALQRDRLLAAMLVLGSRSEYILQLHEHIHDMIERIQAAKLCHIVVQLYKRSVEWYTGGWRGPRVKLSGFDARLMHVIGVDVSAIMHEFLLPLLWELYVALEGECSVRGIPQAQNRPAPVPGPPFRGRCHKYCSIVSSRCPISRARKLMCNRRTIGNENLKELREICGVGLHAAASWERALSCAQKAFTK
ncbi:WD G-beta repeat-containing protein, putative [Babesia ovata]|uniref:WD G-beta repeat-containing protein, putative n=1 Tax=Babesia ovata TaxID=189622 RepID=A0A2H6K7R8_9APIC|nr:WD G-beta repeat-containing protein, putative [Babesia ovata]GBE59043.1 WD G-beta repeat-containing protein, putative [Babesia ovata]